MEHGHETAVAAMARAQHEAWVDGYTAGVTALSGAGALMAAQAQPWDRLPAGVRRAFLVQAQRLAERLGYRSDAVVVPSAVVGALHAAAAAARAGACGAADDSRVVLARVSEMLEAGREALGPTNTGKDSCQTTHSTSQMMAASTP